MQQARSRATGDRVLWVVECEFEENPGVWQPTCYVGISRQDARSAQWKVWRNAGTRTRIRKYVPAAGRGE